MAEVKPVLELDEVDEGPSAKELPGLEDSPEKEAPPKKSNKAKKAADETPEPEGSMEQRLKDTQNWGHKQSEAATAAQRENEELRKQLEDLTQAEQTAKLDTVKEEVNSLLSSDTYFDDPLEAQRKLFDIVIDAFRDSIPTADRIQNIASESTRREIWQSQERSFIADQSDYEEVVSEQFVSTISADAGMRAAWEERGSTPQALYEIAQRYQATQEMLRDPDGHYKSAASPTHGARSSINTGDTPSAAHPPGSEQTVGQGMNAYLFDELAKRRKGK